MEMADKADKADKAVTGTATNDDKASCVYLGHSLRTDVHQH
jgi:hypothetical protein